MKQKSIHTKFPLSKIKKIVQENEEVGKLKFTTPLAVSLCLETFLLRIIKKMKERFGSEKWTESHLKEVMRELDDNNVYSDIFMHV